jgi:hypothetical protein
LCYSIQFLDGILSKNQPRCGIVTNDCIFLHLNYVYMLRKNIINIFYIIEVMMMCLHFSEILFNIEIIISLLCKYINNEEYFIWRE